MEREARSLERFKDFVEEMVDDAIACSYKIKEEGDKSAESGYRVVVALLLREILLRVHTLCGYAAAIAGFLGGMLLSKVLGLFLGG